MKRAKLYLLLLTTTVVLFNCKKYPEGGCERRGPKNIIGDWKLTLYEVNGIDSTELINYNNSLQYKEVSILKNGSSFSVSSNGYISYSLHFSDEKKKLQFANTETVNGISCKNSATNSSIQNCYRLYFVPDQKVTDVFTEWEILKLKSNELIIKHSGNDTYKIKLTK